MARKRLIDTDVYFDVELCDLLGPRGLHLYFRLWGIADDSGVYEPKYRDISLKMGALHFKPQEVESCIQKLIEAGKVIPFASNGISYHWLKNFLKHQPLNNPSPPKHPLPEWVSVEIKQYPFGKNFAAYQILNEKLPEITGSLPVDYPSVETKLKETNRNETNPSEISDEISVLSSKLFLGKESLFQEVIKAISSTRKTGKLSQGVILSLLQSLGKFPQEKIKAGIQTYLDREYWKEGKDEKYLIGIIRNESKKPLQPQGFKSTGSPLLDSYYRKQAKGGQT